MFKFLLELFTGSKVDFEVTLPTIDRAGRLINIRAKNFSEAVLICIDEYGLEPYLVRPQSYESIVGTKHEYGSNIKQFNTTTRAIVYANNHADAIKSISPNLENSNASLVYSMWGSAQLFKDRKNSIA